MAKKQDFLRYPGAELALALGVTRPAITKAVKQNRLTENPDGTINLADPVSRSWLEGRTSRRVERDPEKRQVAEKMLRNISRKYPDVAGVIVATNQNLKKQAQDAALESVISKSSVLREKAIQEKIRTEEKVKTLAPLSLVKYYFSFSENLLQRLYRRPHEIEPQLEALFLAREGKKATQLIVRELESIVVQCQNELIKSIEADGYSVKT